jgi:FAD/FMN-containing dehydrogenase
MTHLSDLAAAIGAAHVATGPDADHSRHDRTGRYPATPLAVARPGSTAEVAQVIRLAALSDGPMEPSPTTADFVPKGVAP